MGEGISGTIQERYPKFFDKAITDFTRLPKLAKYVHYSDDLVENRKANTHNIENYGIPGLKGIVTNVFEFKVKKEDSKIFGQTMARVTIQDPFDNILSILVFPTSWEKAKARVLELSGGKYELCPGVAVFVSGVFQWETEDSTSFILSDILSCKDSPKIPANLKAKSVKISRSSKLKKADILELNREDLMDELEYELSFDGVSPLDDEDVTI